MQVKIISDGTVDGTRIIDARTGAMIGRVQSVDIHIGIGEPLARATIKLMKPECEVVAEAKVIRKKKPRSKAAIKVKTQKQKKK